jgi:5-methylcytosine-specific restriction endonuclease McrA
MPRPQLTPYKSLLAIRDGRECWYCGISKPKDKLTIEHLLSVVDGGSHHINNLVLACMPCNLEAGTSSIAAKVKLREFKRSQINVERC